MFPLAAAAHISEPSSWTVNAWLLEPASLGVGFVEVPLAISCRSGDICSLPSNVMEPMCSEQAQQTQANTTAATCSLDLRVPSRWISETRVEKGHFNQFK